MCREGEEEDGERWMMGHRHPGKNPWKVCRALLLMFTIAVLYQVQLLNIV